MTKDCDAAISVDLQGDLDSLTCCRDSKVILQVFADGKEIFRSELVEAPGVEVMLLCGTHGKPFEGD